MIRRFADPAAAFDGEVLIAAPHMDDEVLACGGTVARLPHKARIHVVFATDGARSPEPAFGSGLHASADLPAIRRAEAHAALRSLGIPEGNRHFLDFPDGALRSHLFDTRQALLTLVQRVRPAYLFVPFRYDRHPDHLALHDAALQACRSAGRPIQVVEYFVYYRWRLIPGGDVRRLIAPEHLLAVNIDETSRQKMRALECYVSQTTRFFEWQDRPILPRDRVEEVSIAPELFLPTRPEFPATAVLARLKAWVPIAHRMEPVLKRAKDTVGTLGRRALGPSSRT